MFNKSIVIAALCSAAAATTTTTTSTTTTGTTTGATKTGTTTGTKATTGTTTTATTTKAAATVAKIVRNAEAGTVLCDQGDSGIWKEADVRLTNLLAVEKQAKLDFTSAETAWKAQDKIVQAAKTTKENHTKNNKKYFTDRDAILKSKNDLVTAAGVTVTPSSTTTKATLDAAKKLTTDAGKLVDAQLARVEKLVEAKRAQDKEEAKWEERRAASAALKADLDQKVTDATAWETRVKETFTKRSFLFQMLGKPIDQRQTQTDWKQGCAFGPEQTQSAIKTCDLMEKSYQSGAGVVFHWGICYSDTTQNNSAASGSNSKCMPHGLDDDAATTGGGNTADGLTSVATAMIGKQKDTTNTVTATQLYAAYETANYEYSAGTAKMTTALAEYKAWQEKEILAEMLWMGCWYAISGSNTVTNADIDTECKAGTSGQHSVWINYQQVEVIKAAASLRLKFDQSTMNTDTRAVTYANVSGNKYSTGTYSHIMDNMIEKNAEALASIWIQGFVVDALAIEAIEVGAVGAANASKIQREKTWATGNQSQWDAIGCTVARGYTAGCLWKNSILGKAEIQIVADKLNQTVNSEETAALEAWKALATKEETALDGDLGRARALLTTLTNDIAPLARKEFTAQAAYDKALAADAAKAAAVAKLGKATVTNSGGTTAATGEWAVLEAAEAAVTSVTAQQGFHDQRLKWAEDVMKPLKTTYDLALAAQTKAVADVVTAKARLIATRDACKVAAFGVAQTARTDKLALDAQKVKDAAAVVKAYTTLSAFPTTGAGALCHFPKVAATADKKPRTPTDGCGDGLCCGAAQRFLKDGTKLTIETCQKETATTYTYYPALAKGALVQPAKETWRFSCISAARKLAAAATAALATGYMMA